MEPFLLMIEPKASINSCKSRLPPPSVSARSKRFLSERIWVIEIDPFSDSLLASAVASSSPSLPNFREAGHGKHARMTWRASIT